MRALKRDEGVSMVIVGVLLAVLLALAGMAVDLGAVYAERRELRNGADAAALAIAEDCGMRARPCDEATARATAQEYLNANAHDDATALDAVDLSTSGATAGSVRVTARAWDAAAAEAGVRVPLLSLLGFDRVEVGAAATAVFDHPSTGGGLPLIIDTCEFYNAGGWESGVTTTLFFHSPSSNDPPPVQCPSNPAHWDFPGGFGWLAPNEGRCGADLAAGSWAEADEGNNVPRDCNEAWLRENVYDHDILIPMYVDLNNQEKLYLVAGFSSFHVTAYKLSSGNAYTFPAGFKCGGSPADTCLQGYFTSTAVYTGDPGGDDYGVVLIQLVD